VIDKGWRRRFDDPIETLDGTRLSTLREAVAYFAKTVPKLERDMLAVTTAAEMLTYAAERGIAWMFLARIGVLLVLHRHEVRQFNPARKALGKAEAEEGRVSEAIGSCVELWLAARSLSSSSINILILSVV
jgi:hypothetical protein